MFGGLGQDCRLAVRTLWSTRLVSAVAVLSLALGIGANAAIFSLVGGLLLRPLPVRDPGRLAGVAQSALNGRNSSSRVPTRIRYAAWDELRRRPALFDGSIAWSATFSARDEGETVVVLGYGFWQRRFGGSAEAVGRTLPIDAVPFTIIGVTPARVFGAEAARIDPAGSLRYD